MEKKSVNGTAPMTGSMITASLPVHAHENMAQPLTPPLNPNPGFWGNLGGFFKEMVGDYYNVFRLIGYFAENHYSEVQREFAKALGMTEKQDKNFRPVLWKTDWHNKPRAIVNSLETTAFMIAALFAFLHDRRNLRDDIGDVVAVELGKSQHRVGVSDMIRSENPLVQTAMNRFKNLYLGRFIQPLTFLWGLRLGVDSTVLGVVGERIAFFNKNSFDNLTKIFKEVKNNEWGMLSRDHLAQKLLQITQQNRAEHKSKPIHEKELLALTPIYQHIATRILEKKYLFSDAVFILGEVIKHPHDTSLIWNEIKALDSYGLPAMAKLRERGSVTVPVAGKKISLTGNVERDMQQVAVAEKTKGSFSAAIPQKTSAKDIVEQGGRSLSQRVEESQAVAGGVSI